MYIREDLQYFVRTDISIDCLSCENLFVEIMFNSNSTNTQSNKSVIVGVIYRHPGGSCANFQENLISIIHKFNKPNTQLVILGDFNTDISKQTSETKVSNYIKEIYSCGCYSLINKPTRITAKSATTLEHVYTNVIHKVDMAGILVLDVSDHLPTFCVIKGYVHKKTYPRKIVRDMKNFNVEGFCEDVSSKLASMFKKIRR